MRFLVTGFVPLTSVVPTTIVDRVVWSTASGSKALQTPQDLVFTLRLTTSYIYKAERKQQEVGLYFSCFIFVKYFIGPAKPTLTT